MVAGRYTCAALVKFKLPVLSLFIFMETARSSFLYILPQNITMQYARIAFIVIIGVALPNQIKLGEMQLTLLTQLA